ncbi:MAG: oligosaccharide flippase family protein [Chlorobium sp.]|nr:oligosaccharide flippase family protein [Chlorobium sp.]
MNNTHESLRRTISNAYLLTVVGRGADVLFFVGIFTYLSVEEVGLYSWALAVAAFFSIAIDLGFSQTLIREFSKKSLDMKSAAIGGVAIRIPILVLGLVGLFIWDNFWKPGDAEYWAVALAGSIQIFVVAENFCQSWLKANSLQTVANILATIDPLGRLVVFVILMYGLKNIGVHQLLMSILFLHVFIFSILIIAVRSAQINSLNGNKVSVVSIKVAIKTLSQSSIVFGLIGFITVTQNRLDWLMVSKYGSNVDLANYSLANKGYEILMMLLGVAMVTVYPWICRQNRSVLFLTKINIITVSLFISGVILSLGAALYMPLVLEWIWSDKYRDAQPLLQVLLPVAALSTAIMILYYQLIARGAEQKVLKIGIISTVAQVAVNMTLIPRFGAYGAVLGMAILACGNLIGYSFLAYTSKVRNASQLWWNVGFLIWMLIFSIALWASGAQVILGGLGLLVAGVVGGYLMLASHRERIWLKAWVNRVASRHIHLSRRKVT